MDTVVIPEPIADRAASIEAQLLGMQTLARDVGESEVAATRPYFDMLQSLYVADLPLARLLDNSDIVMHAEGPAVRGGAPQLTAVNWLASTAQKSLRLLSAGLFDLLQRDATAFMKVLDLRLTGFAPGSLYAGFAVADPPTDLLPAADEPIMQQVRAAIHKLPRISALIGDESISPEVREVIPDPAQRDNAFTTLLKLAPTGKLGIHSLGIASPGSKPAVLSQRERVVLRDAIDQPRLTNRKHGIFTGELLEMDLGKSRFHVRNISGVGSLRCVAPPTLDRLAAKVAFGEQVRVTGDYETDRAGKPRLMLVSELSVTPRPAQLDMSS